MGKKKVIEEIKAPPCGTRVAQKVQDGFIDADTLRVLQLFRREFSSRADPRLLNAGRESVRIHHTDGPRAFDEYRGVEYVVAHNGRPNGITKIALALGPGPLTAGRAYVLYERSFHDVFDNFSEVAALLQDAAPPNDEGYIFRACIGNMRPQPQTLDVQMSLAVEFRRKEFESRAVIIGDVDHAISSYLSPKKD